MPLQALIRYLWLLAVAPDSKAVNV